MSQKPSPLTITKPLRTLAGNDDDDDDLSNMDNLDFIKNQLKATKQSRKLNASTKNQYYNQLLQNYLDQRNEIREEPVKVEMVNGGGKLLTKPFKNTAYPILPHSGEQSEPIIATTPAYIKPSLYASTISKASRFPTPPHSSLTPSSSLYNREISKQNMRIKRASQKMRHIGSKTLLKTRSGSGQSAANSDGGCGECSLGQRRRLQRVTNNNNHSIEQKSKNRSKLAESSAPFVFRPHMWK